MMCSKTRGWKSDVLLLRTSGDHPNNPNNPNNLNNANNPNRPNNPNNTNKPCNTYTGTVGNTWMLVACKWS